MENRASYSDQYKSGAHNKLTKDQSSGKSERGHLKSC